MQSLSTILQSKTVPSLARSITAAIVLAKVNAYANQTFVATRFKTEVLTLVAPSPIEAAQLKLRSEIIRQEINALFDKPLIKRLAIHS